MSTDTDMLERYLEAERAVLEGQAFQWHDGRRLTMANLPEIQRGRAYWERRVTQRKRQVMGGISTSTARFYDA